MTRGAHTDGGGVPRPGRPDSQAILKVLEPGLARHFGRASRIRRLDRRPFEYSTSFTLEAIDVTLDSGDRLELVFKDLGPDSLIGDASQVRPDALYDLRREIAVYQHVLVGRGLGTPTCYAAVADERVGRYWLFLERVPAARLCHVGDFAIWEEAARWLARFHGRRAETGAVPSIGQAVPLLNCDEAFYRAWPDRARRNVAGGPEVPTDLRRALDRIADRYDVIVARLTELDAALIHGEFYGSNVLVRETSRIAGAGRICPIDWEMASVGPGLLDLAALTSGGWSDAQREAMASAYRCAMTDAGLTVPSFPQLLESLNWCRLHLAVQWLGWSADWQAPPDQAHDWLGEAATVARALGL